MHLGDFYAAHVGEAGVSCGLSILNLRPEHAQQRHGHGKLLLLEHMRPGNPVMGLIFDLLNPFMVRLTGANINRRTMDNIIAAGWTVQVEERLHSDIVRLIEAKP